MKAILLLLSALIISCDLDSTPDIQYLNVKKIGLIDRSTELTIYHDTDNHVTCYIMRDPLVSSYNRSISCVKDEVAPPK